jgi:hypothetical protein
MRNKKGALELGVNAIVVLIIALTVLGIAIAFIIGAFSQVKAKFTEAIGQDPFSQPADTNTPIKFLTEDLSFKAGTTQQLVMSVYNNGANSGAATQTRWIVLVDLSSCRDISGTTITDPADPTNKPMIQISPGGFDVPWGQAKPIKTFVYVAKVPPGEYTCQFWAGPTADESTLATTSSPPSPSDYVSVSAFVRITV